MDSGPPAKAPPLPSSSRLPESTLVETVDGPARIVELLGKVMPVLTRFPDGRLGFRMMTQIRKLQVEEDFVELVRRGLPRLRLGAGQVVYTADFRQVAAGKLRPGDRLEPGWSYPDGYSIPDLPEYDAVARGKDWQSAIAIDLVLPAGRGTVIAVTVKETASYFLTHGARCRAQV